MNQLLYFVVAVIIVHMQGFIQDFQFGGGGGGGDVVCGIACLMKT